MRFDLAPLDAVELQGADRLQVVCRTKRSVQEVWREVAGPDPLHWCRLLHKVQWTSPLPGGVGTTRRATLVPGVHLHERYIAWEEAPRRCYNAFTVVSGPVPGLARFGESYEITETASGSELRWTFTVEPRFAVLGPLVRAVMRLIVRQMQADTNRYFGAADA